jgi:UDPglucose 6-dehydrogenase
MFAEVVEMTEKIGIVGMGKLGIAWAALMSSKFSVYGVDASEERIRQIQNKEKFFEPHVNEYLDKYGKSLEVSTEYNIVKDCYVVFVLTQTPSLPNGKFDVSYVESAVSKIHEVNSNCLIVISSTINIGVVDELSRKYHKQMAYNPEFIKQGSIINDFLNPKMVLIGAYTERDGEKIANIWRKFHNRPIHIVKPIEAEIIKLSLNVSFTLGITFANIIGELSDAVGADSNRILDLIYQDRRDYKKGLGFMGPCFPRDTKCFGTLCKEKGVESGWRFTDTLDYLNHYTVERYTREIKKYRKKNIGFLGISYKPNIPYIEASQPLEIASTLEKSGHQIFVYDPLAQNEAKKVLKSAVFCKTVDECVQLSEVLFIGTANYKDVASSKQIVNPWK